MKATLLLSVGDCPVCADYGPTIQEVEDAGLAGFVKKECHFEDWQSLIETYLEKS